jgi:hypothetical protein
MHAHEETLRFRVTKLGGIDDIATSLSQESGDAMDDAALVVAGERKDVFWVIHGAFWSWTGQYCRMNIATTGKIQNRMTVLF